MKTNSSMNYFSAWIKKIFILGFLSSSVNISAQTIITDRQDYPPNSVATISGYGFQANENVTLQVTYADGSPLSAPYGAPWTVAADNLGGFSTLWNVCFCPYSYLKATANGDAGSYDEIYFTDAGIDFHQASNQGHPATPISWINGILNPNNSDYFEGLGVPQRIILYGFPSTNGNVHTLTMSHQATKSGAHAYDFLISWTQAKNTAAAIGNGSTNELLNLFSQECNGAISATASGICSNLSAIFPPDTRIANPSVPDVMGDPPGYPGSDVDGRISCFESNPAYGNRTIEIRGNAAITAASIVFNGYSQNGNDNYADYTVSWTSTSTEIMILFAGRSAQGDAPCGYGAGHGSGSISGGPYHFKLDQLDGFSLGSQDNQIQANAAPAPIESCSVGVTANDSICAGDQVTLTAVPVGGDPPYSYLWSTGATTASINASPSVTTTYTVTITDEQLSECSSSATVTVSAVPVCNISASASSVCQGQSSATLTASGGDTYLWSTGATTAAITVSPNSNTTYTVTVTNAEGCSSSCSSTVTVNNISSCNIAPANPSICQGQTSATLTASGGGTYLWSTGATTASITVSPNSNTTYTVTVTSADGCTSSCSKTVNVNTAPSCNISPSNPSICQGQSDATLTASGGGTYLWSTGATTASIVVAPNSNTTYTVTVTSAAGCTSSCSQTVNVNAPPSCNISPANPSICQGQSSATLTASGGSTYLWSTGATTASISVSPNSNTTYTVTVTSAAGCTSSCSKTVNVNAPPSCNIAPNNASICSNEDVTLTASGGASYLWSTGSTNASITVSPNSNTTYTVTVTSAAGCTNSCSKTVSVTQAPTCSISGPSFLCLGGPGIFLTAAGGSNCSWEGPDLFSSNDCTIGPFDQQSQSGTYTVTVSNNQCSSTCSQSIVIIPCSDNHCGFTQGAWGSAGGRDCNHMTTTEILNNLLVSPLVIGCGGNTLTFTSADVECLIDRMPGGGPSAQIFGQNTCSSIIGINLQGSGRFRNVLLAQTITLALNTRYDQSMLSLQLTGTYMETMAADNCPPAGNPVPNTSQVFTIPMSVLNYLGSNNTVQDLLNLANNALCGAYTPSAGNPTLADINKAEDALNQGFDECRFLVAFSNTLRNGEVNSGNETISTVSAYPNPFSAVTTIQFTAEQSAEAASVDVFNATGEHVATLFNGNVEEGLTYKVKFDGSLYAAGVYTYRISNSANTYYDKLILIK